MQKNSVGKILLCIRSGRGFLLGLAVGAMLTATGSALSQDEEKARGLVKGLLYAVAELSINTETNATKIAALRDRLDALELTVVELSEKKK